MEGAPQTVVFAAGLTPAIIACESSLRYRSCQKYL